VTSFQKQVKLAKYQQVGIRSGLTGKEIAEEMLKYYHIHDVQVVQGKVGCRSFVFHLDVVIFNLSICWTKKVIKYFLSENLKRLILFLLELAAFSLK
jgi:hypothetical protein